MRRGSATLSTPATRAEPLVGRARPTRILMVVVLPAPLGPTKPRIWPRSTDSVSRSSATNRPYFFVSSLVSTTGWPEAIVLFSTKTFRLEQFADGRSDRRLACRGNHNDRRAACRYAPTQNALAAARRAAQFCEPRLNLLARRAGLPRPDAAADLDVEVLDRPLLVLPFVGGCPASPQLAHVQVQVQAALRIQVQ